MYKYLTLEVNNGVATVTLNRPDVYNAFNDGLTDDLQAVLKSLRKDLSVRVVVITGAGKAFSSGQDLKEANAQSDRPFSDSIKKRYNPIIRAIRKMPKPVICRLNGVAAGAGCSLALACDIILAAKEAKLIEVFINIGLVMDSGSTFFLPRQVGYQRAFEMATMGTRLSADQALEWGLINGVAPLDELDDLVKHHTDYFAKAPTKAIAMIKKMLNLSGYLNLDQVLKMEARYQDKAGATNDYREGIKAFMEKRLPEFKGN